MATIKTQISSITKGFFQSISISGTHCPIPTIPNPRQPLTCFLSLQRVECGLQKRSVQILTPRICESDLILKRVFAIVIKVSALWYYQSPGMLSYISLLPYVPGFTTASWRQIPLLLSLIRERHKDTKTTRQCKDGDRDWSQVSRSQRMPRISGSRQKLKESHAPSEPQEGANHVKTLISDSDLQNSGTQISIVLSHRICDHLLWQPQETHKISITLSF